MTQDPQEIQVMISKKPYRSKEQAHNAAGLCKMIYKGSEPTTLTTSQIVKLWAQGYTIAPAEYDLSIKTMSKKSWKKQKVFAIDIDEFLHIEEAKELCFRFGVVPIGIYTSFRHTEKQHKFRLVFELDEYITDYQMARKVIHHLRSIFTYEGYCISDPQCKDPERLFFGGREIYYLDPSNILTLNKILQIPLLKDHPIFTERKKKQPSDSVIRSDLTNNEPPDTHTENCIEYTLDTPELEAVLSGDYQTLNKLIKSKLLGNGESPWDYWTEVASIKQEQLISNTSIKDYWLLIDYIEQKPLLSEVLEVSDALTRHIPLHYLIGVNIGQKFHCFFHNDRNPSAVIYRQKDKRITYHCFGCNTHLDPIEVMKRILNKSFKLTKDFICKSLGIALDSEWLKTMRVYIQESIKYLKSDLFEIQYPRINEELISSRTKDVLIEILRFCWEYLYDKSLAIDERPTFFASANQISKFMKKKGYKTGITPQSIKRKLKFLCIWGLLDCLSDEEIYEDALKRSKSIQEQYEFKYRSHFYSIPLYNNQTFIDIETNMVNLEKRNFRRSYLSEEHYKRATSHEDSMKVYVQSTGERNERVDHFYQRLLVLAIELIDLQGYFTESQLLNKLKGYKTKVKTKRLKECLPSLIKDVSLNRVIINSMLREILNIPNIIKRGSALYIPSQEKQEIKPFEWIFDHNNIVNKKWII